LLGETSGGPSAQPGSGQRPGEAGAEQGPLDLQAQRVRRKAGDAEEEADDEVRSDRPVRGQPDGSQQRRHPQRAEDDADRPADEADRESEQDSRSEPGLLPGPGANRSHEQVEPVPREDGGDPGEQSSGRDEMAEIPADERPRDRRRRHPEHDPAVDSPLPRVPVAARRRGRGADRDVRPGGRARVARGDDDRR
jgi:hypothetical protein